MVECHAQPNVGWGWGLILPQLNVPAFVDSPWEPLPVGRSICGVGSGGGEKGQEEGGM